MQNKEYYKKWYERNKEKKKSYRKKYYKENKDIILEKRKIYDEKNYERNKEYRSKYYQENKDIISLKNKIRYIKNKDKIKERDKLYYQANKEKILKYKKNRDRKDINSKYRIWEDNKYKTDEKYNINKKISRAIRYSVKDNKNGKHWEDILGYTTNDLIRHLKLTIPKGYKWKDFLEGKLHIDHIIPIKAFNYNSIEHTDFKRCWELKNLRLLPASENHKKRDKLSNPFQPALKI